MSKKTEAAKQRVKYFIGELEGLAEELENFDDELEEAFLDAYDAGYSEGQESAEEK